jgi:hypothetical protein
MKLSTIPTPTVSVVVDEHAPKGDLVPSLARLLVRIAKRRLGEEGACTLCPSESSHRKSEYSCSMIVPSLTAGSKAEVPS